MKAIRIISENVKLLQDEYVRIQDPRKSGFQTPGKTKVTDWMSFWVGCGRDSLSVTCVCGMREIVAMFVG